MLIIMQSILTCFVEMAMKEPFIYFVGLAILSGIVAFLTKLFKIGGNL